MKDTAYDEIAASAISKLDEEYESTLKKTHSVSLNKKQEDGENMLFAAAFDERKNELQPVFDHGGFNTDEKESIEKGSLDLNGLLQRQLKAEDNNCTDAIRKAVETMSIKNKDSQFQRKFVVWQQNQLLQQQKHQNAQQQNAQHQLIPTPSYQVFHTPAPTRKSRLASADLSRSATIAEAVVRLSLLPFEGDSMLIDIIGVDHVECDSPSTVRNTFQPFIKWLKDYFLLSQEDQKIHVHFRLIGRELPIKPTTDRVTIDLLDSISTPISSLRATASYHTGLYHEFLEEIKKAGDQSREYQNFRVSTDLALGPYI